ncbi:hypothetical protein BE04_29945 [Sorangium cellulosum]|uniref:Uncharacterized protein n=1 Tax=Sorangium cellulosum TaxID=56 RepID=A0A150PDS4_SORCE|nr:hypothetical protein BE04_29945 [Sorangium cellulosum]
MSARDQGKCPGRVGYPARICRRAEMSALSWRASISSRKTTSGRGAVSAQARSAALRRLPGGVVRPWRRLELWREPCGRPPAPRLEDGQLRGAEIVGEGGALLHREQDRHVPALGRQLTPQAEQGRRLADLPRRVQDEIALLRDQPPHVRQASHHGQGVVVGGIVGAGRVEGARHGRSFRPEGAGGQARSGPFPGRRLLLVCAWR